MRFLKAVMIGIAVGTVIGGVIGAIEVGMESFGYADYVPLFLKAIAVIGISIFVWFVWQHVYFIRESLKLSKLLTVELDVEQYLSASEQMLHKVKLQRHKKLVQINVSVGYQCQGRIDEAIQLLQSINLKNEQPLLFAVVNNNLACFYADQGNVEQALHHYQIGLPYMEKTMRTPALMASLLSTQGIMAYTRGEYEEAERLLISSSQQANVKPLHLLLTKVFLAAIYSRTGRNEQALALLAELESPRTVPIIASKIQAIREELNAN